MDDPAATSRLTPGRSCVACRRRKIRCDRDQPCSYCTKLHLQCVYPGPDQAGKKQPETQLLSRLERIETSLLRLESRIANVPTPEIPESTRPDPFSHQGTPSGTQLTANSTTGRLVSEQGDTRYVTSSFWADLDEADKDEAAAPNNPSLVTESSPARPARSQQKYGPMFGSTIHLAELVQLHPTQNHVFSLWQVFLENVDPVLKMVHVPVTQRQILRASQNLAQIPSAFESLMFSIYYSAVASIQCSASCRKLFQEERQTLLDRYELGVGQALSKADFMSSPDVTSLQALTMYLVCARHSANKTYIFSMTGLLIRSAMKLGLHRDPVALGLSPFLAEMRRRLWWHIVILDVRTAEDNDMDPLLCEHMFDTKFPANVNDADLDINMTEPVSAIRQRTEMTYTLTRFEGSYAARKLVFSSKFNKDNGYPNLSLPQKNDYIEALLKDLEEKYLRYCDRKIPICFLTVTSIRMVLAKVKLTICHPSRDGLTGLTGARLHDLVQSSIEIIEYAHTLRTSDKYSRWVWLFQKYIEWDAVAFLLHCLGSAAVPDLVERAWNAVDTFFKAWEGHVPEGERRWGRLLNLRSKAAAKQSPESMTTSHVGPSTTTAAVHCSQNKDPTASTLTSMSRTADPQSVSMAGAQCIMPTSQASLPQVFDPNIDVEYGEWNFDNVSYIMQEAPSWDMELDENSFNSWM
ncbi:fungal-specific transcription factor domain-containing protein [Exophiala viscosa]|uniref:fungal-specific transcription factor domain-containing protein n=1 Tax=Exophiala viscosa TaxID=2486360 RepID=UPI0021A11ABC|nr:fungal-specific transcription factor domain-containing protein [Exophiala viscosa]